MTRHNNDSIAKNNIRSSSISQHVNNVAKPRVSHGPRSTGVLCACGVHARYITLPARCTTRLRGV